MKTMTKPKFVFTEHAVERIVQRRVPISSVSLVAQVGVTVQSSSERVMKRGDVNGRPIHVVIEKPATIVTVYFSTEWQSKIEVKRQKPKRITPVFA